MKSGYLMALWWAIALSVVVTAATAGVTWYFAGLSGMPAVYVLIIAAVSGVTWLAHNELAGRIVVRKTGIIDGLILMPILTFLTSLPLAVTYLILSEERAAESGFLLIMLASIAVVTFITSGILLALPAYSVICNGFDTRTRETTTRSGLLIAASFSVVVLSSLVYGFLSVQGFPALVAFFSLPVLSLVHLIPSIIVVQLFRRQLQFLLSDINKGPDISFAGLNDIYNKGLFGRYLRFRHQYPEIASGKTEMLTALADEALASIVIREATRDFDAALIPALKAIGKQEGFHLAIRNKALVLAGSLEKFSNDQHLRYSRITQSGYSEKVVSARTILSGTRVPQAAELTGMLRDTNHDVRKTAITIAFKYGLTEVLDDIIISLCSPETEKEAFTYLKMTGGAAHERLIAYDLKNEVSDRTRGLIINLLGSQQNAETDKALFRYMSEGSIYNRIRALKYLKAAGFRPSQGQRQSVEKQIHELLRSLSLINAFQVLAGRNMLFLLHDALAQDRRINTELLFGLTELLYGSTATELIRSQHRTGTKSGARLAAEVMTSLTATPLRHPFVAFLGSGTNDEMLRNMDIFFPLRDISVKSLPQLILSAERSIGGTWTRACAIRHVSEGRLEIGRDLLVSTLFSKIPVIHEESARAIIQLNPGWLNEVVDRLPEQSGKAARAFAEKRVPDVATIFNRTRFLSLCFRGIPEETILNLGMMMDYSEYYDARSKQNTLQWVVPSESGKSGLYSLQINDITDFIFHYSEFADIFVDYIDNVEKETIQQLVTSA